MTFNDVACDHRCRYQVSWCIAGSLYPLHCISVDGGATFSRKVARTYRKHTCLSNLWIMKRYLVSNKEGRR